MEYAAWGAFFFTQRAASPEFFDWLLKIPNKYKILYKYIVILLFSIAYLSKNGKINS